MATKDKDGSAAVAEVPEGVEAASGEIVDEAAVDAAAAEVVSEVTQLIPQQALVPSGGADALPMPAFTPEQMVTAVAAYQAIQKVLDEKLADCTIEIKGRVFRKKSYWRAVRAAFALSVTAVAEKRVVLDDGNWGWLVTYRASTPQGRSADGDGACFESEKTDREGNVDPIMATDHNVRAHAHTRAWNRSVSNLVGFGEVSAEEMDQSSGSRPARRQASRGGGGGAKSPRDPGKPISEGQQKLLRVRIDIAKKAGRDADDINQYLRETYSITKYSQLTMGDLDAVLKWLEADPSDVEPAAEDDEPFL